jgi:hypothetical protein
MATLRDDRHALRMEARDRQIGRGESMPALCLGAVTRCVLNPPVGGGAWPQVDVWTGCQTAHGSGVTVDPHDSERLVAWWGDSPEWATDEFSGEFGGRPRRAGRA